jgi:polyisoprenoid-binding protein YceI
MKRRLLIAALVGMALRCREAEAAEYRIRPEQSELAVLVFKTGFAAAFAHDHVVRATRFSGSIRGDSSAPTSALVEVTVAAAALSADEPEMRTKHGLAAGLSDGDRREIQATMLGATQLDVAAYPDIAFRSAAVESRGGSEFLVTGDFTLHGTTRRIRVPVTARLSSETLRATGSFEVNQSDFGITPIALFFGAVRNQDRIRIIFDLVATP